ncbi:MAG: hydrogenase maturation nickel metallochaperone HypA [Limnochordaceae bacterium]|nr:hydrogenase maturation nickel metallochaperone HypA [Limnochordaceae bacterium]
MPGWSCCWIELRVFCPQCGVETDPRPHSVACGRCGSLRTRVVAGEELDVVSLEVERDDAADGAGAQPGTVAQRRTGGRPAE